jgi:hypothetical protein
VCFAQGEKRLRQLVDVVKGVTLRRTKAIIADQLPRKTDNVVFCQLQPLQYRWVDIKQLGTQTLPTVALLVTCWPIAAAGALMLNKPMLPRPAHQHSLHSHGTLMKRPHTSIEILCQLPIVVCCLKQRNKGSKAASGTQ